MNCFNHQEKSALGICKHCNKGICNDCLRDTGDGLACKGRCYDEVIRINQLIDHNKKIVSNNSSTRFSAGILYICMGAIFTLATIFFLKRIDPILTTMGILFLIYGVYTLIKAQDFKKEKGDI